MVRKKVNSILLVLGIVAATCLILRYLLPLAIPFLVALFFAWVINPIVNTLQNKFHIKRNIGALVGIILLILIAGGFLWFYLNKLTEQIYKLVYYVPFYRERAYVVMEKCCCGIDLKFKFPDGKSFEYANGIINGIGNYLKEGVFPKITTTSMEAISTFSNFLIVLFTTATATYLISIDYGHGRKILEKSDTGKGILKIFGKLTRALGAYVKAQGIIMIVNVLICTIALVIIDSPYFLVLAIFIGIFDALPILGSGMILIPWGLCQIIFGNMSAGIILLVTYVLCAIARQIIEPRVMGSKMNMSTLVTLITMYVGFKIYGISGFVLGPIGFLFGREIYFYMKEQLKC